MDKKLLLNELSQLMEIDISELNEEYPLAANDLWDSLTIVSTIASVDDHYNVAVQGKELEVCETVGDLFLLLQKKVATNDNITSIN